MQRSWRSAVLFPIVETIEEQVLGIEQRALDTFLDRADVARLFTFRR
jgi:magnesium transporter